MKKWVFRSLIFGCLISTFCQTGDEVTRPVNAEKETLTVAELNRRYVLTAFGLPVGSECNLVGQVVQTPEKPGHFIRFRKAHKKTYLATMPRHLVLGELPRNSSGGEEFAVRVRVEIGLDDLASQLSDEAMLQAYMRILEPKEENSAGG